MYTKLECIEISNLVDIKLKLKVLYSPPILRYFQWSGSLSDNAKFLKNYEKSLLTNKKIIFPPFFNSRVMVIVWERSLGANFMELMIKMKLF